MRKGKLLIFALAVVVATIFVSQVSVMAHVNYRALSKESSKSITLQKTFFNRYYKMKQWIKMTFVKQEISEAELVYNQFSDFASQSAASRNSADIVNRAPIAAPADRRRAPIAIPVEKRRLPVAIPMQ